MKKLLSWGLKILPILTIVQGISSGGARLGPLGDAVMVTLTQYEVIQITKKVAEAFDPEKPLRPEEFSPYIRDNFYNQYSVLAREWFRGQNHDLSLDIWGTPFKLILDEAITDVRIASAGPDREFGNKDDVSINFQIDREPSTPDLADGAQEPHGRPLEKHTNASSPTVLNQGREVASDDLHGGEFDQNGYDVNGFDNEGYDVNGFDANGIDRQGYDTNGVHSSEKEATAPESVDF